MSQTAGATTVGGGSFSIVRLVTKITLFMYGYFFLYLFRDDVIKIYINERYQAITVIAGLLLFLVSIIYPAVPRRQESMHPLKSVVTVLFCLFMLSPVIYGFIVPPTTLGASAERIAYRVSFGGVAKRYEPDVLRKPGIGDIKKQVTIPGAGPDGADVVEERVYAAPNLMELVLLLSGNGDDYLGDSVALRGFVYHSEEEANAELKGHKEDDHEEQEGNIVAENEFLLVRYMTECCVAHAKSVAITVNTPIADKLEDGTWVEVYGKILKRLNAPEHELSYMIDAEMIETVEQPGDPYIKKWMTRKPFNY